MTLLRKFLICTCTLTMMSPAFAAQQTTVRQVKTDLDTTHIIVPESFEVDIHNLMKDWYLTRYTVMDYEADKRPSVSLTDADYIERLQKLPTEIEMPYNSIVGSFIRMYVERKKGLVESMLGLSLYYMPIFEDTFDKYGLPLELTNLAIIESALNPTAVSRAGATGLWQFMPSTGKGMGLEINTLVDERRDPYKSTDAAARFLKQLYNTYGDWSLAIAAYNCGPGNVNKAIRRAGGGKKDFWEIYNYLPSETRTYIPAFIAANYAMNYYKEHNISPVLASKPIIVDSVKVNNRVHFKQISDILGISMDELRALNPQYRADVIPGDIKPYTLVLPHIQTLCYVAYEDSILNYNADQFARRDAVEPGGARPKLADNTPKQPQSQTQQTDRNQQPSVAQTKSPASVTKVNEPEKDVKYVEIPAVLYHKVKPEETIEMIAERYGIAQADVIRANGGNKKLRKGDTLQLNITERRPANPKATTENQYAQANPQTTPKSVLPPPAAEKTNTQASQNAQTTQQPSRQNTYDSRSAQSAQVSKAMSRSTDNKNNKNNKNDKNNKQNDKKNNGKDTKAQSNSSHTVKAGDTLFGIAKKNGTTVEALKKANNIKSDNIQIGSTLKIPGKGGNAKNDKKGAKNDNKTADRRKRKRN